MAISLRHPNYREPTGMTAKYFTSVEKSAAIGNGTCKSVATGYSAGRRNNSGAAPDVGRNIAHGLNDFTNNDRAVICWP